MTQQQIAYRNLAIAQQQADAATSQAATSAKRQKFEEGKLYRTNFWTGLASTVGGILAALFI